MAELLEGHCFVLKKQRTLLWHPCRGNRGVEKTREGLSILKLSCSGVEKTCEGLNYPVLLSKNA